VDDDLCEKENKNKLFILSRGSSTIQSGVDLLTPETLLLPNKSIPARRSVALFWDKQGPPGTTDSVGADPLPTSLSTHNKSLSRADDEDDGVLKFEIGYSSVRL
jgi:hypothetical protein